jgi:hypothetical protein
MSGPAIHATKVEFSDCAATLYNLLRRFLPSVERIFGT